MSRARLPKAWSSAIVSPHFFFVPRRFLSCPGCVSSVRLTASRMDSLSQRWGIADCFGRIGKHNICHRVPVCRQHLRAISRCRGCAAPPQYPQRSAAASWSASAAASPLLRSSDGDFAYGQPLVPCSVTLRLGDVARSQTQRRVR
jgi:hypothetical protein